MTKLLGAVLILIGIGCIGWSLTADLITGEHMAIMGVAAFTFAGAMGIWQIADQFENWLKK